VPDTERSLLRVAALVLAASASLLVPVPATAATSDVEAKLDFPCCVAAGNAFRVLATITTHGPDPAQDSVLTIPTPPNTTFAGINKLLVDPAAECLRPPVGGTGTIECRESTLTPVQYTIFFNASPSLHEGDVITVEAHASSATPDSNPANNDVTANRAVTLGLVDLHVAASLRAIPFGNDAQVFITLTVTNSGPYTAQNAKVVVTNYPSWAYTSQQLSQGTLFAGSGGGTWAIGNLAPGATATAVLTTRTVSTFFGPVQLTAAASADNTDATPADNAVTLQAAVTPADNVPAIGALEQLLLALGLATAALVRLSRG